MQHKLNLRAPLKDRVSLKFGDFLTSLPAFSLIDPAPAYNYPMDFNDSWGDCLVAGYDHFKQIVTGLLTGVQINLTEAQILAFYRTQNPGFNPAIPGVNDNGMCIQTFLEYLQANKYILGFGKIDYTNTKEVQAAIYIGLALIGGVVLQQVQETQFSEGQLWNPVPGSPVIGRHCVIPCGYFAQTGNFSLITWGKIQNFTQAFLTKCFDELWFVVTPEHIAHPNFRDNFNLAGFIQAVEEISNNQITINTMPIIQQSTTNLIEQFEGLSLKPYQDVGGVWTIGYGATYDLNGNPITANTPVLTPLQATQLLAKQLQIYANEVTSVIKVILNQNQFDACTSLCYNIGTNGFAESTVARMCNANNFPAAAQAFLLWDKVKGVTNAGLLARRNKEMNLFLKV
jgi:lysozyme